MLFNKMLPINCIYGGPELGVCFDVYVTREASGRYRMDFSWRDHASCAVTFSKDGLHWEYPVITLAPNPASGWEDDINRNCVVRVGDVYHMWYTGQANGKSYLGHAQSADGLHFERTGARPVMVPETDFEKDSVMNPCVLYENGVYRMWYAAGETYEPNVLCYAESDDGLVWKKSPENPIFVKGTREFEQDRVGGCQVVHTDDMGYLMMYIGYRDIDTACVCLAKSPDGIHDFVRSDNNPMLSATPGTWDEDSTYKPSFLWDEAARKWRLWYNGRRGNREYVGYAEYGKRELFS